MAEKRLTFSIHFLSLRNYFSKCYQYDVVNQIEFGVSRIKIVTKSVAVKVHNKGVLSDNYLVNTQIEFMRFVHCAIRRISLRIV